MRGKIEKIAKKIKYKKLINKIQNKSKKSFRTRNLSVPSGS
jgi:hypothetical protein